jgi:hypothetical protein
MARCIGRCKEGECKCPQILASDTIRPMVRYVDGYVHIHIGVHEYVMTADVAQEFGLLVVGQAAFAHKRGSSA